MIIRIWGVSGALVLTLVYSASLGAVTAPQGLCGSASNAAICFASIDRAGKLNSEQKARLAAAAPLAIDIVSSPQFANELAAFHSALPPDWRAGNRYWRDFDPVTATAATRDAFSGLHIDTIGGLRARFSAIFAGNLAYEGSTDARTGERNILLNRFRLDRPKGAIVGTYVHEAAHKAGYSHQDDQNEDQKCEPPYVMGQLAQKMAEPDRWPEIVASEDVCRFWLQMA